MLELHAAVDNPENLKVLVVSNFLGHKILQKNTSDSNLEFKVDEYTYLRSSNAAILYLCQASGITGEAIIELQTWLEWEALYMRVSPVKKESYIVHCVIPPP